MSRGNVIQGSFPHGAAPGVRAFPQHLADRLQRGGVSLPPPVCQMMESHFRTSFADVRVHVGQLAAAVGARAVTHGSHIHFAPGHYDPDSPAGRGVLALELAHVVQQRSGLVRNPLGSGLAIVRDPALEMEAQRMATAVVQLAKVNRPPGAVGTVTYTYEGAVRRAVDANMNQWHLNRFGTWTKRPGKAVPLYNRFRPSVVGRGGVRKASYKSRHGSAASYAHTVRRGPITASEGPVTSPTRKKRAYVANMLAATAAEGHITTGSATEYANHFHAPAVAYNWCHLIGHGAGGTDDPDNLVAASTHCNSEQLAIESVLYRFRTRGVSVRIEAEIEAGTLYLAKRLTFMVKMNGRAIWIRSINGYRTSFPTFTELTSVKEKLVAEITKNLPRLRF
jgi:hypothetical protein